MFISLEYWTVYICIDELFMQALAHGSQFRKMVNERSYAETKSIVLRLCQLQYNQWITKLDYQDEAMSSQVLTQMGNLILVRSS